MIRALSMGLAICLALIAVRPAAAEPPPTFRTTDWWDIQFDYIDNPSQGEAWVCLAGDLALLFLPSRPQLISLVTRATGTLKEARRYRHLLAEGSPLMKKIAASRGYKLARFLDETDVEGLCRTYRAFLLGHRNKYTTEVTLDLIGYAMCNADISCQGDAQKEIFRKHRVSEVEVAVAP